MIEGNNVTTLNIFSLIRKYAIENSLEDSIREDILISSLTGLKKETTLNTVKDEKQNGNSGFRPS